MRITPEKAAYDKEYRAKNKEKILLRNREYQKNNKEKIALQRLEYRRSKIGVLDKMFNHMKERGRKDTSGRFDIMCSRKEFNYMVQTSKFYRVYAVWVNSGFQRNLAPSIDRIDNTKGYVIGNMQIITQGENTAKGNKETKSQQITLIKNGKSYIFGSHAEAAKWLGAGVSTVSYDLKRGYKCKGYELC